MARHLYIAGVDYWPPADDILTIEQALTYEIDTCAFNVQSAVRPTEGEEVIIEDDDLGRLFAGIIVGVELVDKDLHTWSVECDDYTALIDRKLVVETYENTSASDIFLDIATLYCSDFTTTGVQTGAPEIEYIRFDYLAPSGCFKQLCDYVGWHWQPDYYKDLQLFGAEELASPAPMALTPGGQFSDLKHSVDIQGLRNRVYILGGRFLSDAQPFEYVADGKERIWTLPLEPHSPWVSVSEGTPIKPGLEGVDDEADYAWMYSQKEKYIRCSNATPTPTEGATVAFVYQYPMDVISMVEDTESQHALAAVQGGDGIYEHKLVEDSLITLEAAEAAGMADLREHANPTVSGSFSTEYTVPAEYGDVIVGEEITGWQEEIAQTLADDYEVLGTPIKLVAQGFAATSNLDGAAKIRAHICAGWGADSIDTKWWIYSNNSGVPGTAISDVTTVPASNWIPNSWISFELDLNTPLQEGETYFLVGQGQAESGYVYWNYLGANIYAGGHQCASFDGGSSWNTYAGCDSAFKIDAPVYGPLYGYGIVTPAYVWQPGQLVDIQLPDRGIEGTYLVQKVTISPFWSDPGTWNYQVQYGGRLIGLPDLLCALVAGQKHKMIVDVQYQTKFVTGEDLVGVLDEFEATPRTEPWYCGDIDAICGEIVCLAVS